MPSWFGRDIDCVGSAFFPGALPPRPEYLDPLLRQGVEIRPIEGRPNAYWCLELTHPAWGRGRALALREMPMPPGPLIDLDPALSEQERQQARMAGCGITVERPASRRHLLRDRKHLLRFLRAVMGDDGLLAADHTSSRLWSRRALDDELSHDADVDIEALYALHLVRPQVEESTPYWLHSHGLGELGFFDFDILDPHEDVIGGADMLRALALAVVEGSLVLDGEAFPLMYPGGQVRLVSARRALSELPAFAHAEWRTDLVEDHIDGHGVACEPASAGWWARLRGREGLRTAAFLSRPLPENLTLAFSSTATDLMSERARASFPLFVALADELRELEVKPLVKVGYQVDGGGESNREHLWFEVHGVAGEQLDATLLNEPYHIARMRAGQRGTHPVALLSDWVILTPAGTLSPRGLAALHTMRERREELLAALRASPSS